MGEFAPSRHPPKNYQFCSKRGGRECRIPHLLMSYMSAVFRGASPSSQGAVFLTFPLLERTGCREQGGLGAEACFTIPGYTSPVTTKGGEGMIKRTKQGAVFSLSHTTGSFQAFKTGHVPSVVSHLQQAEEEKKFVNKILLEFMPINKSMDSSRSEAVLLDMKVTASESACTQLPCQTSCFSFGGWSLEKICASPWKLAAVECMGPQ